MLKPEDPSLLSTPVLVAQNDLVGKVFAQKFEITGFIGRGGMSDVYKARHRVTGKTVAVKVLHEKHAQDSTTIKRLRQEAQAAGALAHKNILGVHDLGVDESGTPFLVMDFIDGVSFSEFLRANAPIRLDQFLSIMKQVAGALSHAQQKGVVHRDLKPSNIMIVEENGILDAKIVDFGIAKLLGQDESIAQRLTQTGETFGSPAYMSPEQCLGQIVDSRSDIYSFGCVMYEALCGAPPHAGDSVFDTVHRHVNSAPPPLVAPQLDEPARARLEGLILRCLAKGPADRFDDAAAIEKELCKIEADTGGTVLAQLEQAWKLVQAKHAARRKTKVPLLVSTLFVMAILSIGSSGWLLYTSCEVNRGFQTLHSTNRARVKYLQAYIDATLIYKQGQLYFRKHNTTDLDAMKQVALRCQRTLDDAELILKDEPSTRELYAKMNRLIRSGVDGYLRIADKLPEDGSLYAVAPELRNIVKAVTAAQQETIELQDQEDEALSKLSDHVAVLQRNLILIGILTLVLNGAVVTTLAIYFIKQKAALQKQKAAILSDVTGS
jgi:serine/threonine protein kinase